MAKLLSDDEVFGSPAGGLLSDEDVFGAPAAAAPKEQGFASRIAEFGLDLGKRMAGAVTSGVASIPLGVEQGVRASVRSAVSGGAETVMPASVWMPGLDSDEAVFGRETARERAAREIAGERAASAVPDVPGARALADAGKRGQEAINATTSQATQDAVAGSQITGNIFKGEIDFGKDPSVRGYVMQAADVFGSMLPVVATALATRRPDAAGAVGGAMAAGEGAQNGSDFVASKTDAELLVESPFYRRMIEGGATPQEARQLTSERASESAALLQGVVASVGDRFTGKLVTGQLDNVLGRAAGRSVAGRAAAGAAMSSAEEGMQEVGEGLASDFGIASAVPTKEIGEDSAANLVLGALGGGPVGGARGAVSGVRDRRAAAAPAAAPAQGEAEPSNAAPPEAPAASAAEAPPGEAAAIAPPTEAEQALRQPVELTALDRVGSIDTELAIARERQAALQPGDPATELEQQGLAAQVADLERERAEIASTWPRAQAGAPTSFSTESGVKLEGQYALMDADDLQTSHDEYLRPNAVYPAELQPRDRGRHASELQVQGISQKLDPARLGVSGDAATGAPIVGADGLVESGNGRTIALKRIYRVPGAKAMEYRQWLRDSAQQFGLAPEAVDSMSKPVLVRVRSTPVNRAEFARQANASTVQRMAPSEQALSDARRLTSLEGLQSDEDGDFTGSRDFIRQFMAGLPITEQSDLVESDGRLSTAGYRRIQNAVLAKAYGDSATLRRMTESLDNNLANISKALVRVAPTIAAARERMDAGTLHQADIAPDLLQAVEGLSALKEKGWTAAQELGQQDLTGPRYTPEAAMLLEFLADNARSPRRMAEFLQRYYEELERSGDPSQPSMFGDDAPAPARADLLKQARGPQDGNADQDAQRGVDREGAQAAAPDGRESADAAGGGRGDQSDGPAEAATSRGQQSEQQGQAAGGQQGEWVAFDQASGTLGIPRAEMPQVQAEHRSALAQFLRARGIDYVRDEVLPGDLKPTQAEYSPKKVERAVDAGEGGARSVLVAADGYILDGHHQWMAHMEAGTPVPVLRFAAPIRELLAAAAEFPSVESAGGAVETRADADPLAQPPDARLSRGGAPGVPVADLQALVNRVRRDAPNLPAVHVLNDPADAPYELRAYINRQDAWHDVDGAMHEGELYLFAANLPNLDRAEHVLIEHEAGHFGLRAILGPAGLRAAMTQIWNQNARVRREGVKLQERGRLSDVAAAEEVIVDIPSDELASLKGWRKVVLQVRDWLAGRGYERTAKRLTEMLNGTLDYQQRADLFVADLMRAARGYVAGKRQGSPSGYLGVTRLSGALADALERRQAEIESAAMLSRARDELGELAAMAVQPGNANRTINLGPVAEGQVDLLTREGVPVTAGFTHSVDMFAVRHALNRHSDAKVEAKQGQLSIGSEDIAAIPQILAEADALLLGAKTPRGQDIVGSLKRLADGTVLYLEEVRSGRKTLAMTSMRKYPGTTDFETIKNRIVPSYARSDAGDVRIVYPEAPAGQEGPRLSRAQQPAAGAPVPPQGPWLRAKAAIDKLVSPENIDKLIYEFQDKLIDLKRLRDHIRQIGGTISELNDAYQGEEAYHGRVAKRTQDFLEQELRPLLVGLNQRGISLPDFERYLHARHAQEANREMAARNPNQLMIDAGKAASAAEVRKLELALQSARASGASTRAIESALEAAERDRDQWGRAQAFKGTEAERLALSGMDDATAKAELARLSSAHPAMASLAAQVDAINSKTMDALQSYGLMDPAVLRAWKDAYQHYVPLHRDEAHPESTSHPIGQGFSIKGDVGKRRVGSNAKVTHILGHIAMQREAALSRGEKNLVAQKLYTMAAQNPDPEWWEIDRPPRRRTVDANTGLVQEGFDPLYKQRDNVVVVRIAGKDAAVVFNERNPRAVRLAAAMKNLDASDLHVVLGLTAKATRWFAAVNTQYNPVFGLINFARDVQGALLNLSTTALKGKEMQVAAGMPPALRGIYQALRGGNGGHWGQLWEEMQQAGGMTGYRDLYADPKDRTRSLEKVMESLQRGKASAFVHGVLDWLSDYNETMEGATRLAAYKVALDEGMTRAQAASIAKNLTVNFNRKGRQTREIGALYAFFNAAVQGSARLVETLRGPAGRKIMLGGVLMGAMNALIGLWAMGSDDDDEENGWTKIPEFVRERSLVIPLGKEDFVAIPLPLGFNVLPNIGRKAVEAMAGVTGKSAGANMAEMLGMAVNAFNPFGAPSELTGPQLALMVSPTVTDPVISLLTNKDWTGKPIYREDSNTLDPTPGHLRSKDTATTPAKLMSLWLNKMTGGTDYRPGWISWTPDQLDYVVGQLTGGVGRELMKVNQVATTPFTGEELPAHKIPLLGRIYGNTRGQSGESGRFYDNVRELNEVENELKGRERDGGDVDAFADAEPLVDMIAAGKAAEREIRELRRQRQDATKDGDTGEVRAINDQMAEVMRELNREVARAKREAAQR